MSEQFIQILSRVHTYQTGLWPYTDNKHLSPYHLASFGYMIAKPYLLQCFVCHHQVPVPQQFDADFSTTLKQITNHKQNCIYSGENYSQLIDHSPISKESIYLMIDELMVHFKQTYNLLTQLKTYPLLNKQQIQNALTEDLYTFKSIDQAYKLNSNQSLKITFFLQFFGWNVKKDQPHDNHLNAECLFCGRKVSLDKVKFIDKDQQSKNVQYSEKQCFSPVSEHRYFCLWVNPKCSGYKGYTIYIQHLFDKINESKSLFSKRPPEQTKKIRVEMDKYLESFQQKTSEQFEKIKNIFNECENLKNSIRQSDQIGEEKPLFQQSEKKMKEFTNNFIGQEIKESVKKIKLN